MHISFKILEKENISKIIPLVYKLNEGKVAEAVLVKRFNDMIKQNYECAVIQDNSKIIGVAGLWFCTRHYSGRSLEIDHVFIEELYRNNGLGDLFMQWITNYAKTKNMETIELNTYVQNHASHKFYFNKGFKILGYHFLNKLSS